MKVKTYKDAWDNQQTYTGEPHGWIQWSGTEVCVDIHCECGELTHFDGCFMYVIECPFCHRKYMTNGHIQLIEIDDPQYRPVKISGDS